MTETLAPAVQAAAAAAAAPVRIAAAPLPEPTQVVTFRVLDRHFGVDVRLVREIKSWIETTPLPRAPEYVRGVLNLRGVILAVYDLRARLGLGVSEPSRAHVIVVVDIEGRLTGLLVDSVSDIFTVAPADIRPIPDLGAAEDQLLTGLVLRNDALVALLDLRGVVAPANAGLDAALAA